MKNKKIILTVLIMVLLIIGVIGCGNSQGSDRPLKIETTRPEDIEYAWQKIIKSEDSFSNCGFTHFQVDETCMYVFETYGDDDLTWDIYILDSEWEDADRYIPQAFSNGKKTDIRMEVKEGQYVYAQCPHNDFTSDKPLRGNILKIYKS